MKSIALTASVALAAFATPAFAQNDATSEDMGGLFVGAVVGYDHMKVETPTENGNIDALLYGINASYDIDSGAGIFGIEAEISDSTASESSDDLLTIGDRASIGGGRDIYGGVRVGLQIDESEAIYLKAGYTNKRFNFDYNDGATDFDFSDDLDGFRLGVGYETMLAGFTARVEYRYSEYDELEVLNAPTGVFTSNHQAALVIGKRF